MRPINKFLRTTQLENKGNLPMPVLPLIEIYGQRRILIENHFGVVCYGCHEVQIKVRFGVVRVCGDGLHLNKMSKDQLIITGTIDRVDLWGNG